MFRDILVPVDLTDKNQPAILTALELAAPSDSVIRLLHVIQTIPDIEQDQLADFYRDLYQKAAALLEKWRDDFASIAADVRTDVTCGARAAEIIAFAEDKGCDLILMSTHRVDEKKPGGGIGTISHQVALLAGCPVLLLR